MKINTEIDRLAPGTGRQLPKVTAKQAVSLTDEGIEISAQGLARAKGMVDALIVAQMARSFMQKAEVISSRLRGVAMDAMLSGKMNEGEFKDALTGINTSLGEVNESFAPAMTFTGAGRINPEAAGINIPEMKRDFDKLKTVTADLMEGRIPEAKEFDKISESISRKAGAINDEFTRLKKSVNPDMARDIENHPDLTGFVSGLGDRISRSPEAAFLAQGNLKNERVNAFYIEGKL